MAQDAPPMDAPGAIGVAGASDNRGMSRLPEDAPLPDDPSKRAGVAVFDPNQTGVYQARLNRAPRWVCSILASTDREKTRVRSELTRIKGALPLLMKTRNGGQWSVQERAELRHIIKSASAVSPYLFIWALPGSVLLLPLLAWHLDARRKGREGRSGAARR